MLPDQMFAHAASGYGGQGALCGALGACAALVNLVVYDKEKTHAALVDELLEWYGRATFPTDRFDDLSKMPKQLRAPARSPLCHTSVSTWAHAAGVQVTSAAKKERCAKVTGEVVFTTVERLNLRAEGKWKPARWAPAQAFAHCVDCHGPDSAAKDAMNDQQGHSDCLLCHEDHTK